MNARKGFNLYWCSESSTRGSSSVRFLRSLLLNQFLHRLMPVHKVMRPAREISHSGFVNVNSHVVVRRREDLLEMHRSVVGFAA